MNMTSKTNEDIPKEELFNIINSITPLNNKYRDLSKAQNTGNQILRIMWQVGDLLEHFIAKHEIKPHFLYWQIYGKANQGR